MKKIGLYLSFVLLLGCTEQANRIGQSSSQTPIEAIAQEATEQRPEATEPEQAATESELAKVTRVEVSGETGAYTFTVTVASPDTGCDTYADWWEVISPEGELLYRRILAHSHVDEQPFTRSGGPIAIDADQPIIVRVHMHPTGYSPLAMAGVAGKKAFAPRQLPPNFAAELAEAEPQPSGCAF